MLTIEQKHTHDNKHQGRAWWTGEGESGRGRGGKGMSMVLCSQKISPVTIVDLDHSVKMLGVGTRVFCVPQAARFTDLASSRG